MKQVVCASVRCGFYSVAALIVTLALCSSGAVAQTADSSVSQVTFTATDREAAFAGDMSGTGRFVVIESSGNIATENPDNADGNREIFLFDYAQRRIFQITHTRSALEDPAASSTDAANIAIEVSNNKPVISYDGRFIAFSSNATTPARFNGNDATARATLTADGNQEIFLYQIPAVTNVDLSRGIVGQQDQTNLEGGVFTPLTNTPASRTPQPGQPGVSPFIAFDNRTAAVNDDASIIAFVSTRNFATANNSTNVDGNPEIFVFNRTTNRFSQITDTRGIFDFSENPTLSGNGSVVAFISNANLPTAGDGSGANPDINAEVYLANFNGTAVSGLRQVTRTEFPRGAGGTSVNVFSPGRRLSRNGNLLAFESRADLAGDGTLQPASAVYVYNVAANTFTQAGRRATLEEIFPPSQTIPNPLYNPLASFPRFPTFTGDSSTLVFSSGINFSANGSAPGSAAEGLNPDNRMQIFSAPAAAPSAFTRLTTNIAASSFSQLQPYTSDTARRIAFSFGGAELGGGNADSSTEVFYLNVPTVASDTPASANAVSYLTGTSRRSVTANPTAPAVAALAPGMLGIARSS